MSIAIEQAGALDRAAILALLDRVQLPQDGLADRLAHAFVARQNGAVVGSAVLEMYADGAAIAKAMALDVAALYTTTAERFFPRFGFAPITRDHVPPGVRESVEFRSACPAKAIVMRKTL